MEKSVVSVGSLRRVSRGVVKGMALALLMILPLAGRAEQRAVKQRVAPVYPELAKRMKISGEVKLEATVDADGKVTDVKVVSGSSALVSAAEDALRKWKYVPGAGVDQVDVTISFAMNQ